MKKRFIIGILVLIILLSVSRVFAVTSNNTIEPRENTSRNSVENRVNSNSTNSTNELSEEDLIPALEEKLKEEQSQEDNSVRENTTKTENTINKNVTNTTKNDSSNTKKEKKYDTEILSDVYVTDLKNDVSYENTYIDGNVYIISSAKVEFKDCEISGSVFIISDSFELNNTKIEGSSFVVAEKINLVKSQIKSVYAVANTIESDEDSEIVNDIRAIASVVNVLGEIGRDSYIQVLDTSNVEYSVTIQDILPELIAKYVIILLIAIFVLCGFPKFVGVNLSLKISSFFKAFFTGILEIIIITLIALTIMVLGFGAGYAFAVLILLVAMLCLGKVIFVIAFALRLVKNKGKNVRVKAFIFTIFVAAVVEAIELIMVLGETGFAVNLIINMILAITGFGTLMRVIFTSKTKKVPEKPKTPEPIPTPVEPPIEKPSIEEPKVQEVKQVNSSPIVEHNLKLEVENVSTEGDKPEIYEITGKIIKRKISPDENKLEQENIEKNDESKNDESKETNEEIKDEKETKE